MVRHLWVGVFLGVEEEPRTSIQFGAKPSPSRPKKKKTHTYKVNGPNRIHLPPMSPSVGSAPWSRAAVAGPCELVRLQPDAPPLSASPSPRRSRGKRTKKRVDGSNMLWALKVCSCRCFLGACSLFCCWQICERQRLGLFS